MLNVKFPNSFRNVNGIVLVFICIALVWNIYCQLSGIGILDVFLSFLLDDTMVSLFFKYKQKIGLNCN